MGLTNEVIVAILGLMSAIFTGSITYKVTRKKSRKELTDCKEKYLDDKLKEIITLYQTEVMSLRDDMRNLTSENLNLRNDMKTLTVENVNLRKDMKKLIAENVNLRDVIIDLRDQLLDRTIL